MNRAVAVSRYTLWVSAIALGASLICHADSPHRPTVVARFTVGGKGGWDAATYDDLGGRLFVAHGDRVTVLSTQDGQKLGEVQGTDGIHAIALVPELGKGFTSDGKSNTVTVFDLSTLKVIRRIVLSGRKPDAIVYEPKSQRVVVFDGASDSAEFIDPATESVTGSAPLPSNPEFAVGDGQGNIYVNLEDIHSLGLIDATVGKLVKVAPLPGCEGPTGIAFDPEHRLVFSSCQNRRLSIFDVDAWTVTGFLPIGERPDGAAFDPLHHRVYSSNGGGTLSVFQVEDKSRFTPMAEVPTQTSARTLALDSVNQRIFLPAAEFGAAPPPTVDNPHPRGTMKPDSFVVLVVH